MNGRQVWAAKRRGRLARANMVGYDPFSGMWAAGERTERGTIDITYDTPKFSTREQAEAAILKAQGK
jgi:hypothetical protein